MARVENPDASLKSSEPVVANEILNDYNGHFLAVMNSLEILSFPEVPLEEQSKLKYGYTERPAPLKVRVYGAEANMRFPRIWDQIWQDHQRGCLEQRTHFIGGRTQEGLCLCTREKLYPRSLWTPWGDVGGFLNGTTVEQWSLALPHILQSLAAEELPELSSGDYKLFAIRTVGEIQLPKPRFLSNGQQDSDTWVTKSDAWKRLVGRFVAEKQKEFGKEYGELAWKLSDY